VFPYRGAPGDGCGWTALRIELDNPGVWLLHCHIIYHGMMGMGVVLHVKSPNAPLPSLPRDVLLCGDPAILYRSPANLRALLPYLLGDATNSSAPSAAAPVAVTTSQRWWDYILPALTVFAVIAATVST
jgi:hypothetical protein